ncbi:TPA: hypothetical protein ACGXGE_003948 [Bacillus pacificus]
MDLGALVGIVVAFSVVIFIFLLFILSETLADKFFNLTEKKWLWVSIAIFLIVIGLVIKGVKINTGFSVLLSLSAVFWSCKEILSSYYEKVKQQEADFQPKTKSVSFFKGISVAFIVFAFVYEILYVSGKECEYLETKVEDGLFGILGIAFLILSIVANKSELETQK